MGVDVKTSGTWQEVADRTPSGAIIAFGGTTPPAGWLLCDGAAVSRATYATLFSAIGVTWGAGDGTTSFNVPDLRGASVRGVGQHGTETMANGNPYEGPAAVGVFEDDQFQGHWHNIIDDSGSSLPRTGSGTNGPTAPFNARNLGNTFTAESTIEDTDNGFGPPRAGDETHPFAAGVHYIIKV